MEKSSDMIDVEGELFLALAKMEDIAEKNARIHSRLLTDPALAKELEKVADNHAERKNRLTTLVTGKPPKEEEDEA